MLKDAIHENEVTDTEYSISSVGLYNQKTTRNIKRKPIKNPEISRSLAFNLNTSR